MRHQDCEVTLVGSTKLATYAEAELHGAPASDTAIRAEIAACFRDGGKRTDTIVLACTHYPLLICLLYTSGKITYVECPASGCAM